MRTKEEIIEFKVALERRTKEFAVSVFELLDALPRRNSSRVISYQLGKSASSIGANYREANRAESKGDFAHKLQIALKEASESAYWFEVLAEICPEQERIHTLLAECVELRNLFQAISKKIRRGDGRNV